MSLAALAALAAGCTAAPTPTSASSPRTPDTATAAAASPAAVLRARVGGKPCGVLALGHQVWVSVYAEDAVRRVDRTTGAVSAPVTVGSQPCGLAAGGG